MRHEDTENEEKKQNSDSPNPREEAFTHPVFGEMEDNDGAYIDGMKMNLIDKAEFWRTVIPQYLSVSSKSTLSFSVCFTWQHPKDGHTITAEVEDGECVGCPVDG